MQYSPVLNHQPYISLLWLLDTDTDSMVYYDITMSNISTTWSSISVINIIDSHSATCLVWLIVYPWNSNMTQTHHHCFIHTVPYLLLDNILFVYRSSRHDSTKCTPFLLMYGREAHLPIDITLQASSESQEDQEIELETKVEHMLQMHSPASKKHKRIRNSSMMQSITLVLSWRSVMWCLKNDGRKGGKLEINFKGGPYTISEDVEKGRFRLKDAQGKTLKAAIKSI